MEGELHKALFYVLRMQFAISKLSKTQLYTNDKFVYRKGSE